MALPAQPVLMYVPPDLQELVRSRGGRYVSEPDLFTSDYDAWLDLNGLSLRAFYQRPPALRLSLNNAPNSHVTPLPAKVAFVQPAAPQQPVITKHAPAKRKTTAGKRNAKTCPTCGGVFGHTAKACKQRRYRQRHK